MARTAPSGSPGAGWGNEPRTRRALAQAECQLESLDAEDGSRPRDPLLLGALVGVSARGGAWRGCTPARVAAAIPTPVLARAWSGDGSGSAGGEPAPERRLLIAPRPARPPPQRQSRYAKPTPRARAARTATPRHAHPSSCTGRPAHGASPRAGYLDVASALPASSEAGV
jgi:hypothetical protein